MGICTYIERYDKYAYLPIPDSIDAGEFKNGLPYGKMTKYGEGTRTFEVGGNEVSNYIIRNYEQISKRSITDNQGEAYYSRDGQIMTALEKGNEYRE